MPPKKTKEKYIEAIGRRKTAVARVRIPAKKSQKETEVEITVNEKAIEKYFPLKKNQETAKAPFKALTLKGYTGEVKVVGGGVNAQAEAIRLGFARALLTMNPDWRSTLKALGFLKRDPRMVERKKYGLRKARRPQQWRKR
ncbi:MAG: 30S ribosomal protein S9 [Patescibacteria group bacterium]|nr:30S ribosomal protein S9 [Patescibacteria group bacterium]